MKKAIILGFILMCLGIFTGMVLNDWKLTVKICGTIGLICIGLVGLLNGSFVSGDQYRANQYLENNEDKLKKEKIISFAIALGLPNIIAAIIVFFNI